MKGEVIICNALTARRKSDGKWYCKNVVRKENDRCFLHPGEPAWHELPRATLLALLGPAAAPIIDLFVEDTATTSADTFGSPGHRRHHDGSRRDLLLAGRTCWSADGPPAPEAAPYALGSGLDDAYPSPGAPVHDRYPFEDGPLVGSLIGERLHAPVIDLDFECRLEADETTGWTMLTLGKGLRRRQWRRLRRAFADCGLLSAEQELALRVRPKHSNREKETVFPLAVPAALLPSRSAGHHHLYLNTPLDDERYRQLLRVLRDLDLVQTGWAGHLLGRAETVAQTFVRTPTNEQLAHASDAHVFVNSKDAVPALAGV